MARTELESACAECRFLPDAYTRHDAVRTIASAGQRWRWTIEGAPERAVAAPAMVALAATFASTEEMAADLDGRGDLTLDELLPLVHEVTHQLQRAGRTLREAGGGAASATGTVVQINVSGGGVPKRPVDEARIGHRGLDGDTQAARKHHGRVWQAVSLWSAEVIDTLQSEGHPIAFGLAGENLTVAGIDWAEMRPGVRLRAGTALLELSAYAAPCTKNAQWFVGGDFGRIAHERAPGFSRVYASVLEDGTVRPGDAVLVEPA